MHFRDNGAVCIEHHATHCSSDVPDGLAVGDDDGFNDGVDDGNLDGEPDGDSDGDVEGNIDGECDSDNVSEGESDGCMSVGSTLLLADTLWPGLRVGPEVGNPVGY